jgi:2'-5' RNA ligase
MARRQGVPLTVITSECREVVDRLPPKKYAHITGAKTIGTNAVMLDLDQKGRGRLLQDVRHICEYYEIPFDAERKASYYPHVTVLRAPNKDKADEMAARLDELIASTEPKPAAIGFGDPVPLLGRA